MPGSTLWATKCGRAVRCHDIGEGTHLFMVSVVKIDPPRVYLLCSGCSAFVTTIVAYTWGCHLDLSWHVGQ